MSELFLKIVNMSISAGWLVLAVLALRLVLKKAPKWSIVALWGIVAARLLFPFSIESALSLIPSAETVAPEIMMDWSPTIDSGVPIINNTLNPIISETFAPAPISNANPLQVLIPLSAIAWLIGVFLLLMYTLISCLRLHSKVRTAVRLRDNIYQSERIDSPFVFGVIKPKIYLPLGISGEAAGSVIAHEKAHIRRKDHLWKPFGFLLLTVHWFNPLMWIAYVLLCRDIELACDESVIKDLGSEQRADYSQALLSCSINRRAIAACPIAFGEVGVKQRVKTVLNYKKPAFWLVMLSVMICIIVGVCFLTNPIDNTVPPSATPYANTAEWKPLEALRENYTIEQAIADGCVVFDGYTLLSDEDEAIWYDFYHKTCEGEPAAVRVYQAYLDDGKDYSVKELVYDGEKYLLQYYDKTGDTGREFLFQSEYQYLIFCPYTWKEIHLNAFLLADSKDVTYSGYISRWASSSIPPKDDIYNNCHLIYCVSYGFNKNDPFLDIYGKAFADIDGDGIEEMCCLGIGSTSGLFTFTFSAFVNTDLKYYNIYWGTNFNEMSFVQNEDGKLQVRGVDNGVWEDDAPEIHVYDITVTEAGEVELSENGEALKYTSGYGG